MHQLHLEVKKRVQAKLVFPEEITGLTDRELVLDSNVLTLSLSRSETPA